MSKSKSLVNRRAKAIQSKWILTDKPKTSNTFNKGKRVRNTSTLLFNLEVDKKLGVSKDPKDILDRIKIFGEPDETNDDDILV